MAHKLGKGLLTTDDKARGYALSDRGLGWLTLNAARVSFSVILGAILPLSQTASANDTAISV